MPTRVAFRVGVALALAGVTVACGSVEDRDVEAERSARDRESKVNVEEINDDAPGSAQMVVPSSNLEVPGLKDIKPASLGVLNVDCCITPARVFQSADGSRLRIVDEQVEGNPSESEHQPLLQQVDEKNLLLQLWPDPTELVTIALFSPNSDGPAVIEKIQGGENLSVPQLVERIVSSGFVELDTNRAKFLDRVFIQLKYSNPSGADDSVLLRATPVRPGDLLELISEQPLAPIEVSGDRQLVRQPAAPGVLASASWIENGWYMSIAAAADHTVTRALESASTEHGTDLYTIRDEVVALLHSQDLVDSTSEEGHLFELRTPLQDSALPVICAQSKSDRSCATSFQPPAVASLLLDGRWMLIAFGTSEKLEISAANASVDRFSSSKGNELQVIDLGAAYDIVLSITDSVLGRRQVSLSRPIV